MRDELEGDTPSGQNRAAAPKPVMPKPAQAKPKRKPETPTVTDDLTGKFLRVGNKLYRSSDSKKPFVRLEPDRLKTSNIDALPDILRLAKANGWTSIKINGGDKFKKAAYLAAAAQGLEVKNYTPSKLVQAEADRLRARLAEREKRRETRKAPGTVQPTIDETHQRKILSERFLGQTNAQNARDPELRHAQTLVAQAISIARARYPDDSARAAKDVEAKRQQVAARIAQGDPIKAIQISNKQNERIRVTTQDLSLQRSGLSR